MSFWKFWGNRPRREGLEEGMKGYETEGIGDVTDDPCADDQEPLDPNLEGSKCVKGSPAFDRQRDRHQMSVSRSGRYKQRQRRRSGILDNPGLSQQQQKDIADRVRTITSANGDLKAKDLVNKKRNYNCEQISTNEMTAQVQVEAL